jgi:3-phosphoshikimate 1-carboxyvinyltransferase
MVDEPDLLIGYCPEPVNCRIPLPSSKSESNRALIIQALCGDRARLGNLSTARDTRTMVRLLGSPEPVADVLDAGTTMRFLTAYYALTGQAKTITGTPRMQERPIGILVEALRQLGATVRYLGREGFPPLHCAGFSTQQHREISLRGDVSSQYISAS